MNRSTPARKTWQKAQKKPPHQDPEAVKKRLEEIKRELEEVMPDIRSRKVSVYAIDEVHLLEGDLISPMKGRQPRQTSYPHSKRKKSSNLLRSFGFVRARINFR